MKNRIKSYIWNYFTAKNNSVGGYGNHIDPLKNKGITLIALIVTIILMLILVGVVLKLTIGDNGLIKVAVQSGQKMNEEEAREKLELALEDLRAYKYADETYNKDDYINNYLKNAEMIVNNNIVTVDGIAFEIDRENLTIIGRKQANVTITSDIKERLGNGFVNILIKIESDTSIESIIFPNEDGTTLTITTDKLTLAKDLKAELEKEYLVTVKTIDGKTTTETIKIETVIWDVVKIGDFVNYSVGNWTEADIAKLGSRYSGTSLPTSHGKFGGFGVGTNKDGVINTKGTNKYSGGWRVLSKNSDGTISIIHAGTSEAYYSGELKGSDSVKIFKARNWSMYEDGSTDSVETSFAIAGSARAVRYADYTRVMDIGKNTNVVWIGTKYWISDRVWDANLTNCLTGVGGGYYNVAYGVRPVVKLKSNVKVTEAEGQTTHTTRETAWNLSIDE